MTLNNLLTMHHRWMQRYLERRGWVVFYLDHEARDCRNDCWLRLYEAGRRRKGVA